MSSLISRKPAGQDARVGVRRFTWGKVKLEDLWYHGPNHVPLIIALAGLVIGGMLIAFELYID